MIPADLASALDRFLGASANPRHTAAVRAVALATVRAWRDGLLSTPQFLRAIAESLDAMRAPADRRDHSHVGSDDEGQKQPSGSMWT
jgi:hypothetical protein